jgi:hypothetical protein
MGDIELLEEWPFREWASRAHSIPSVDLHPAARRRCRSRSETSLALIHSSISTARVALGSLRDECSKVHWFEALEETSVKIEG